MGTITININNNIEQSFRETVKEEYGKGKGILGKAVNEALENWIEEKKQEEIRQRQLMMIKKGFNLGKKNFKKRADLHERKNIN